MGELLPDFLSGVKRVPGDSRVLDRGYALNFGELRQCEVRAQGRTGKARNRSDRGNGGGGYSSPTNSSRGTPYALAIFVTVGM
jgi:hypothetical protein